MSKKFNPKKRIPMLMPNDQSAMIAPDIHVPAEQQIDYEYMSIYHELMYSPALSTPAVKSKISGEVISSTKSGYWVAYGGKTEGFARKEEQGNERLNVGEICLFDVVSVESETGCVFLSRRGGESWEQLIAAKENNATVTVEVMQIARKFNKISHVKVRFNAVTGIVPFSLLGISVEKVQQLINEKLEVRVHEICSKTGRLVFNHRIIKNEESLRREYYLNSLNPGDLLQDVEVIGILSNNAGSKIGVIVQAGECRGLIHHSEISRAHFRNSLSESFPPGKKLDAIVLPFRVRDDGKRELALSLKGVQELRASEFFATRKLGDRLEGTVQRKVGYGLFVSLCESGEVDGLLHNSQFSREKEPTIGSKICVEIIAINKERRTVGLSIGSST